MSRTMTGRALTVETEDDVKLIFAKLFVDFELSEDETDVDEVPTEWTALIEASKYKEDAEFTITGVNCIFSNDSFLPIEIWSHISINYETITGLIQQMLESGSHSRWSVEYEDEPDDEEDEPDDEEDDDYEDEGTENYWSARSKAGVNISLTF